MNANELADRLDKISYDCTIEEWRASPVGEAATKLRQQRESIEGLNRDYDLLFAEYQLLLKKEWVELTDEEISKIIDAEIGFNSCWGPEENFARAIEAKLKDKNT